MGGKIGRPKRRWLNRARGDIKEKGLSGRESTTELHIIVEKSGTKMKRILTGAGSNYVIVIDYDKMM